MRVNLLAKGAILAALSMSCLQPAAAQSGPRGSSSATKQSGGVRDGGGNALLTLATDDDIREVLRSFLDRDVEDERPNFLDPRILAASKSELSDEERSAIRDMGYMITRVDGGPRKGKTIVERMPTYANPENYMFVQEMKLIQDVPFRNLVLRMINENMRIDEKFIEKHEVAFKQAFERYNPNRRFDINDYKNLIIEVNTSELNAELVEYKIQDAPCGKGVHKTMSVYKFELFSPICVSRSELKKITDLTLQYEVLGLLWHEQLHQFGIQDEAIPVKAQQFILKEVATRRHDLRISVRNLVQEAFDVDTIESNDNDYEKAGDDTEEIAKADQVKLDRLKNQIASKEKNGNFGIYVLIQDYAHLTKDEKVTLKRIYLDLAGVLRDAAGLAQNFSQMWKYKAQAEALKEQFIKALPLRINAQPKPGKG